MGSALARLAEVVTEASQNATKLPGALVSCGVALSVMALALAIFRPPAGILLRLRRGARRGVYYGGLLAVAAFGLAEASFGYWVVSPDVDGWRAIAKVALWISVLPLVLVAALGGSAFLN